jgi:hypothetical protein
MGATTITCRISVARLTTHSRGVDLTSDEQHGNRIRFSLLTLILGVSLLAAWFGLGRAYGLHGAILPLDVIVLCWVAASLSGVSGHFGKRIPKLAITDATVLLFICFLLHGLAMPAVQSEPHPRAPMPTVAPIAPQTPVVPTGELEVE